LSDNRRSSGLHRWLQAIVAWRGRTATPAEAASAPRQFGGYRIEAELGRGALGQVHRAVDIASGARVALKTLALGVGADAAGRAEARARFASEVEAARRLDHPDIVRILAAGQTRDVAWIAMQWVPGHDLSLHTRIETRLPLEQLIRIGARLADALAHAHHLGIIHRDLKPANVLVDLEHDIVKLADFGIAWLHDAARTRTGLALGSPAYMAPEQLAGGEVGPGADIYALGALLFELACSQPPFAGATLGELLRQVAHQSAPDLRDIRPQAPPDLADIVACALAKRPERRPAAAAVMAAQLRRIADALGDAHAVAPSGLP
jgi:eukaryotic-like serine/threonine-protein kinase